MRITKVTAAGFKGKSFAQKLAPVTILRGMNGRGKSARLQALMLAATGAMPGEGKDNQPLKAARDIFDLFASDSSMTVGCETDDGRVAQLAFLLKGGAVRMTGTSLGLDTFDLNALELLSKPGPERTRLLLKRAKLPASMSVVGLRNTIKANLKNIRLEENSAQSEAAINALGERLDVVLADTPMDWLEMAATELAVVKRESEQNLKRLQQTGQGLAQMARGIEREEEIPADAEQRLRAAEAKRDKLNELVAETQGERQLAERQLQETEALLEANRSITDWAGIITEKSAQLAALAAVPVPPAQAPIAEALQKAHRDHQANIKAEAELRSKRDAAGANLKKQIVGLEEQIKAASKADSRCPTCGSKLKRKAGVVEALGEDLKRAQSEGNALIDELDKQLDEVTERFNDTAELLNAAQQAAEDWTQHNVRYQTYDRQVRDLESQIASCRKAQSEQDDKQRKIAAARAALPELTKAFEAKDAAYAAACLKLNQARDEVAKADLLFKKLLARKAEEASKAKAAQAAALCAAELAVAKEAVRLVQDATASLLTNAIGPVLDACNEICPQVFEGSRVYFEAGEFGLERAGRKISYRAVSDSEKLLLCAVLAAALATQSNGYRLLVVPRFESFDYNAKFALVKMASVMTKMERLDQAIFVEVSSEKAGVTETFNDGNSIATFNIE